MSISHSDISDALRTHNYNPDECRITFDPPGPGWTDVTSKIGLSKSVLRDLSADGLEVYAPPAPPAPTKSLNEKIVGAAKRIIGGDLK